MSFAVIRDEVANVLKAVDGIGKVHTFMRHTTTWAAYFERHQDQGKINNWEITRTSLTDEISSVQGAVGVNPIFHDTHSVVVLGHLVVNDENESEKEFQDLIDRITERFRLLPNDTLGNRLIFPVFMQTPIIEHRMFGPTFVHFAQMTLAATERLGGC